MSSYATAFAAAAGLQTKKMKGKTSIKRCFSPSPKTTSPSAKRSSKTDNLDLRLASNEGERRSKRARIVLPSDDGSRTTAPLRKVNKSATSDEYSSGAVAVAASPTPNDTGGQGTFGLVRVNRAEKPPAYLEALQQHAYMLSAGAILGRNSPAAPPEHKTVLSGVSRKHCQVVKIGTETVTIRPFDHVLNAVGLYRYIPKKKQMNPQVQFLEQGVSVELKPGDVIEFDTYNRAPGRFVSHNGASTKESAETNALYGPVHVFRLVRVSEHRQSLERQSAAANTPMTQGNESIGTMIMDIGDRPYKTPSVDSPGNDSNSSFVTARENSQPSTMLVESVSSAEASGEKNHETDKAAAQPFAAPEPPSTTDSSSTVPFGPPSPDSKPYASPTGMTMTLGEGSPTTQFALRGGQAKTCTPKVGDRFRVLYELRKKVPDNYLAFARPAWYVGTVTKVIRNKKQKEPEKDWAPFSLHLRFDDGSTTDKDMPIKYPMPDVQVLTIDKGTQAAYVEMVDNDRREVVYHFDLSNLEVGDVVDSHYQNGAENDAWFRGRVAKIDSDRCTCDVVYFDKEYECNIIMSPTNLCVIEKGRDKTTWLSDLKVPSDWHKLKVDCGARVRKQNPGRITKIGKHPQKPGHDEDLHLVIRYPSSGRTENTTYSELIPTLLGNVLSSSAKSKIKHWPIAAAKATKKAAAKSRKITVQPAKTTSTVTIKSSTKTFTATVDSTRTATSPIARRRELLGDLTDFNPMDVDNCVCDWGDQVDQIDQESHKYTSHDPRQSKDISAGTCNNFASTIKSVQAQVGIELLTQLRILHNQIPNDNLTNTLYEMMLYGPKSNGTFYPDPRKVELVFNYLMGACKKNLEIRHRLINMGTGQWSVIERTLSRVMEPVYRVEGDECLSSDAAFYRISSSLQVITNGLNVVLELMRYQLKPAINDPNKIEELRDQPIVKAFRACGGGVRGALKFIVGINAWAWTHYGHFVVGDLSKPYAHVPPPNSGNVQECEAQALKLLQTLGKIASYTAWVYSTEENEQMDTRKFASTIAGFFDSELNASKGDIDPYDISKKQIAGAALARQWEKVRLRFALDLNHDVEEDFAETLCIKVGEVMGLTKKYSCCFI